ncbi:MAG: EamA family transporter RarD [Neisseria sp.]|nr:EamA family transporter RarD [Neisseria sp.]
MNRISQTAIAAAILSSILFALIYLYGIWMHPVSGTAVYAWRVVGMAVILWSVILFTRNWQPIFLTLARLGKKWHLWAALLLTSAIFASQMWLFVWGAVNGYGIDIAIGYFLFPMVMVAVARVVFHERLNRLQWLAVLFAAAGVAVQIWHSKTFSWVTAWTAGTYPIYYAVRRSMHISAFNGLFIDITLMLPFALAFLWASGHWGIPVPAAKYWLLLPTLGLISAVALYTNLYAAFNLPVALFGMFSYLEPTLLFLLAITVLGMPVQAEDLWTYLLLGTGIILMLSNNYLRLKSNKAA